MNDLPQYPPSDDILAAQEQMLPRRAERIRQVAHSRQRGLLVLMEDVHNPHNLAAIARTCDAFGVQDIAFTVENHARFDPAETGKITSRSASKWLDYRIFTDGTHACLTTLKDEGYSLAATVADEDAQSLYALDWTRYEKLAVMVGNEHTGLSDNARDNADLHVTIPMHGMIRSLNVSVATAIILAEITRQRRATPDGFRLPTEKATRLEEDLLKRAL